MTNTPPLGGGGPRPVLSQGITLIVQPAQCNAWVGLDLEGQAFGEWTSQAFVKIFFQVPLGKSLKASPEALACPCCGHCLTSPYSWVIENLEGEAMEVHLHFVQVPVGNCSRAPENVIVQCFGEHM